MALSEKAKQFLIYLAVLIVITGGVIFYSHHNFKSIRQDYNLKILQTNQELLTNLRHVEDGLKRNMDTLTQQIGSINETLGNQVYSIKASLNDFKQQNQKELNTLSSLIEQIEKQSNIQLNELKSELKDIQVKSADFSAIIDEVMLSVVSVNTKTGIGSGAVIKRGGYIVTNFHVIEGATSIAVFTSKGAKYPAQMVGYDSNADIAVLKIDADLPELRLGDSSSIKVGSKVIALGSPAGLSFTVTEGIISALRKFPNGLLYLQTDVPINPGNSGGPLVDQKGEIVGINNFKVKDFESLGFAISSNDVSKISSAIISQYEAQK